MNYITDYQINDDSFQCKINGRTFSWHFCPKPNNKFSIQILQLADYLKVPKEEIIGIFNVPVNGVELICNSKKQCRDLCQHIVDTYFMPKDSHMDYICISDNGKSYQFQLVLLSGKYVWQNKNNLTKHIIDKSQVNIQRLKEELNIKIYEVANFGYLGFDTQEDASKFAKYIKETFYNTKKGCENSRRQLLKYYAADESFVILNGKKWTLIWEQERDTWYFYNEEHGYHTYFKQFGINHAKHVIDICSTLGLSAKFTQKLEFDSKQDAIKFTDYLIETYIIKKEKTYDTNRLRKERTSLSRGAKPAGSIIHGRRNKASVRCRHIEYKARIGC